MKIGQGKHYSLSHMFVVEAFFVQAVNNVAKLKDVLLDL